MKKALKSTTILALFLVLSLSFMIACKSEDNASTTGDTDDSSTSSTTTRQVSGTLSGDLTNVASVTATDPIAGTVVAFSLGSTSLKSLRLEAVQPTSLSYTLELTVGNAYNINLKDNSNNTVATMEWSASQSGTSTTSALNITEGSAISLGNTSIPAGTDASKVTLISSEVNPLKSIDNDEDGISDFDDSDDDNDGVEDAQDNDDDGDGNLDESEESDHDRDGISDSEDTDSEDVDDDNDGIDNDSDTDDDNDGIEDVDDTHDDNDRADNDSDTDDDNDGIEDVDDTHDDDDATSDS